METATAEKIQAKYTQKDYKSEVNVRWCPGCGDFAILSCVHKAMAELNIHLLQLLKGQGYYFKIVVII